LPNTYILAGMFLFVLGAVGLIVARMRKTPTFDQVPQNVLNRIRTEYR